MVRRVAAFVAGILLVTGGTLVPARAATTTIVCTDPSASVSYYPPLTLAPHNLQLHATVHPVVCKGAPGTVPVPVVIGWFAVDAVLACPDQNTATGHFYVDWSDGSSSWGPWYQAGTTAVQRISARLSYFSGEKHLGTMQGTLAGANWATRCLKGVSNATFALTFVFTIS